MQPEVHPIYLSVNYWLIKNFLVNSFSPHLYLSILRFPPVMVGVAPGRIPVPVEGLVPGESAHQLQFAPWYPSITGWLPTYGEPVREHVTGPLDSRCTLSHSAVRLYVWLLDSSRLDGPAGRPPGDASQVFLSVWTRSAPERTRRNASEPATFSSSISVISVIFLFSISTQGYIWWISGTSTQAGWN